MRVTILALGSRGDVQPYIALGRGLCRVGHTVRIAANANYATFVGEHGLDYASMGGNFRELMDAEATHRLLEKSSRLTYFRDMNAALGSAFRQFAYDSLAAGEGSDAIIFSTVAVSGYGVAEKLQVPCFWAPLQPMSRTREFPSTLLAGRSLGGPLNALSHRVEEQLIWQPFRSFVNQWRTETLGIPPFPFGGPFNLIEKRRLPHLYGYSPAVLPRPRDWPDWMHVTGYWFLDHSPDWQPPAALVDFLQAGPPPVYVGFGSMLSRDPKEMTRLVLSALALAKQRGILAVGWGALGEVELPETVFPLEMAPHDWLFPRMAAVVHHGGAGTTAAGLRAGVPSVIVPFTMDQPFWAQRVYDLGAGAAPSPRKKLTAERLAEAITHAVNDPELQRRAKELGERIRAEDGVANAVQAFEQHMHEGR